MLRTVRDTDDNTHLARRARGGSMDALAALYDQHATPVFRVAYRLLGNRADAEDVVQDVFAGLPRALRSYRGEGALGGWIRRIGVRTALMRMRSTRRRAEDNLAPDDVRLHGAMAPDAPVDRIALQRALVMLPDPLRTVFVLKAAEGYSHDEIAELLDITPEASRTRMARARTQLKDLLT